MSTLLIILLVLILLAGVAALTRYSKHKGDDDGWTEWLHPQPAAYKMACCDCGLVHDMQFKAVKIKAATASAFLPGKTLDPDKVAVVFRVRRNNRATAAKRRKK